MRSEPTIINPQGLRYSISACFEPTGKVIVVIPAPVRRVEINEQVNISIPIYPRPGCPSDNHARLPVHFRKFRPL